VEASTIPATAALASGTTPGRRVVAGPLLRLRSDEQLVRLFRAGSDEAFRVIHDRYRTRLFAYARQMLGGSRADAEDALQDVFVRAYGALRANDRHVSLRAWLYRIAHNRCIDELRRVGGPGSPGAPVEVLELVQAPASDPMDAVERRESLRRLVEDVQRLPEQQRSALLMREMSGMAYQDLATALDVTVPAVKSLLVRARIGLAQASEARDTACAAIRADLADAHERGVRASGLVKRHLHDCKGCSAYRRELRAIDARLAALVPALGPVALFAKLLGIGGGSAGVASGGVSGATAAAAGGGAAAAAGGGAAAAASVGIAGVSFSHVAAAVAVAVVSAGGAVEVQQQLVPHHRHHVAIHRSATTTTAPNVAADLAAPPTAALRREAVERLRLRLIPTLTGEQPAVEAPTLAPDAPGAGNGGATAPAEPPADTLDPVTPPSNETVVEDGGTSATSGSSTTAPPASGSSSAAPEPPPPSEPTPAPPATSVEPTSTTAPTAPPTSATVGGATYQPRR
jgi:RNA polymerase sigma factor (sigma-70 family)